MQPAFARFTFTEYVQREEESGLKHEFLDGVIYAMAGGTPEHAAVSMNVGALLIAALRGRKCRTFGSDLRVRVPATGLTTYPDVTVVGGPLEVDPDDANTTTNPACLIEVLSPSTERHDRGTKVEHYKKLDGLNEIVLISHERKQVEVWSRDEQGWKLSVYGEHEQAVLPNLEASLGVDAMYENPLA